MQYSAQECSAVQCSAVQCSKKVDNGGSGMLVLDLTMGVGSGRGGVEEGKGNEEYKCVLIIYFDRLQLFL